MPAILDAIREEPDDGPRWLALAGWLLDNGRDDEAAAVRVYWPVLRDNLTASVSLDETLRQVKQNAARLGRRAREAEAHPCAGLGARL